MSIRINERCKNNRRMDESVIAAMQIKVNGLGLVLALNVRWLIRRN